MMIEKRELDDIRKHNHMRQINRLKNSNLKYHHINKKQYNALIHKLERSE